MGRGLDSDLLDALNVSEFTLNRLVEPRYRVAVQEQLWTIQKRARNGEDVLADLVALLDRHGELLRYIQFQRFMAPERRRRQQEARRRWEEELERIRRTGEQYQQLQQQQQQEQAARRGVVRRGATSSTHSLSTLAGIEHFRMPNGYSQEQFMRSS